MLKPLLTCVLFLVLSFLLKAQEPYYVSKESGMVFIENKGQWHPDILYSSELPSGFIYLQNNGFTYELYDPQQMAALNHHIHGGGHSHDDDDELKIKEEQVDGHIVHAQFVNANKTVRTSITKPLKTTYNYFYDRQSGVNARSSMEIAYHDLYPGIDFSIRGKGSALKYEFLVHKGANPDNIQLLYKGVETLYVRDGQLVIGTSIMDIVEQAPFVYQIIKGKKKQVNCSFQVEGEQVSFKLGRYNKAYDLVIDPKLIFSTYSGSTADNWGNTACFDTLGNLYTGGTVFQYRAATSVPSGVGQFPATVGAFDLTFNGGHTDIGIMKYDSSGTFLHYATYIGGNGSEIPTSTVVNNKGELVILGTTSSPNFPWHTGAYDSTFAGGSSNPTPVGGYTFWGGTDIVVMKLSPNGDSLKATYVGGTGNDGVILLGNPCVHNYGDQLRGDVNLDDSNYVYVAHMTNSVNFPIVNGFQSSYGGGVSDGVIFKLGPELDTLIWSTYIGGNNADVALSIKLDTTNNAVVSGGTASDNTFTTTSGAYIENPIGGVDGYVVKVGKDGDTLLYATRVGTSSFDQAYFVDLDENDDVYLYGQTEGSFPIQAAGPRIHTNPGGGQFIQKLTGILDTTVFSTVFGDITNPVTVNPKISPTAFLVNECGNIFISGWGGQTNYSGTTHNLPITSNAFQQTTDGSDFYIAVFYRDMDTIIYATYFGGPVSNEHVDGGTSRFDKKGIVYQSVCAGCLTCFGCPANNDFPKAPGSPDGNPNTYPRNNNSANCNNGVFKFDLASLDARFDVIDSCAPSIVTFVNNTIGGVSYFWDFGDSTTLTTTSMAPIIHEYDTSGYYDVMLIATDITTCIGKDTAYATVFVDTLLNPQYHEVFICEGDTVQLSVNNNDMNYSYQWTPDSTVSNDTIPDPLAFPPTTTTYTIAITDSNGCVRVDTYFVDVSIIEINAGFDAQGNCNGFTKVIFSNNSAGAEAYLWDFGDGNTSTDSKPVHVYEVFDSICVTLTATANGCQEQQQYKFLLEEPRLPNIVTPNGDGKNETFIIEGRESGGENWKVEIYNRWGKRLYENENYKDEWSPEENADGTYYFLVTSPDGTKCKGWILVIR